MALNLEALTQVPDPLTKEDLLSDGVVEALVSQGRVPGVFESNFFDLIIAREAEGNQKGTVYIHGPKTCVVPRTGKPEDIVISRRAIDATESFELVDTRSRYAEVDVFTFTPEETLTIMMLRDRALGKFRVKQISSSLVGAL